MTQEQIVFPTEHIFNIKGGRISATILELNDYSYRGFNEQLAKAVSAAPQLFDQMPIVLGLEKLAPETFVDFIEICQICQFHGLAPIAIRGGSAELQTAATIAGLARLPAQNRRATKSAATPPEQPAPIETHPDAPPQPKTVAAAPAPVVSTKSTNRVITAPVRSGQQIYAQGGDLIVMAPVSAGAEILADGNIHVYGPLRGRALAGIKGDTEARIFCQSLEAELISIAGHYRINEDLRGDLWRRAVQIALADSQLQIQAL
jgi:septum site-determining protein MinC